VNRDDEAPEPDAGPPEHLSGATGMDLVRRVLEEARGVARTQGKDVGRGRRLPPSRRVAGAGSRRRWSGPGPDARDPQPLARATRDLAKKQGWSSRVAEGAVFGRWATVVGAQISEHASPSGLRDGVLSVTAESTAWATQLRLLAGTLIKNIAKEVGHNVVIRLQIHGPAAPSWSKGPRRVQGRGPRDTYG
jgi:predicted nucleic acid-binding Zn ribbon protein